MEIDNLISANAKHSANPCPYETAHVSEPLKGKRRMRGIQSCRHRKVRCDGNYRV